MLVLLKVPRIIQTKLWWLLTMIVIVTLIAEVTSLSGPNVCMVKQKYNITKRVKYRAPMSVRTYEWCFAMPPRCSKWNTEMRDVTRLETEERTAEMAVCCPGYKLKDVSCVSICPSGKTGPGCSEECPQQKWGPNCVNDCKRCEHGSCDAASGECRCQDGWQGESCETSMTTTAVAVMEQLLTTAKDTASTKTTQTTSTPVQMTTLSSTTTSITIPTTISFLTRSEKTLPSESSAVTIKKTMSSTTDDKSLTTQQINTVSNNITLSTLATTMSTMILAEEVTKKRLLVNSNYNRTEIPTESTKTISTEKEVINTDPTNKLSSEVTTEFTTTLSTTTLTPTTKQTVKDITITTTLKPSTALSPMKDIGTIRPEITRKVESTMRPPTTKFKPKEIWIRPAQKGESPIIESKLKTSQELPHNKLKNKEVNEVTTPKTIIVSIIPTSVSYVTFKKLALTTASTIYQKNMISKAYNNRSTGQEFTKPITVQTTETPVPITITQRKKNVTTTVNPLLLQYVTKSFTSSTKGTFKTILPTNNTTNSMLSTLNAVSKRLNSSLLTTISSFSTNANVSVHRQYSSSEVYTSKTLQTVTAPYKNKTILPTRKSITDRPYITKQPATILQRNVTVKQFTNLITEPPRETETFTKKQTDTNNSKRNLTNTSAKSNTVTDDPTKDEETFHILTEPEHITAVMSDKGTERSTIDLISVLSIAGGVMMAVITVAVVIVMLERCKRPRYADVRKYNDIRMQVMIDKNDVPPPYVRSIFHTPLPDPPIEKCHYQPISTLDRNLKQFMRPVVVQTISPLMLENFRGILECHYDHLPRRSQDMGTTMEARCSVAPSIDECEELLPTRVRSLTDSDIEAMKCEATFDVLDNTTSEPLYAEIPCWRPPSARAIEVVNLNGEAVTEL